MSNVLSADAQKVLAATAAVQKQNLAANDPRTFATQGWVQMFVQANVINPMGADIKQLIQFLELAIQQGNNAMMRSELIMNRLGISNDDVTAFAKTEYEKMTLARVAQAYPGVDFAPIAKEVISLLVKAQKKEGLDTEESEAQIKVVLEATGEKAFDAFVAKVNAPARPVVPAGASGASEPAGPVAPAPMTAEPGSLEPPAGKGGVTLE